MNDIHPPVEGLSFTCGNVVGLQVLSEILTNDGLVLIQGLADQGFDQGTVFPERVGRPVSARGVDRYLSLVFFEVVKKVCKSFVMNVNLFGHALLCEDEMLKHLNKEPNIIVIKVKSKPGRPDSGKTGRFKVMLVWQESDPHQLTANRDL